MFEIENIPNYDKVFWSRYKNFTYKVASFSFILLMLNNTYIDFKMYNNNIISIYNYFDHNYYCQVKY